MRQTVRFETYLKDQMGVNPNDSSQLVRVSEIVPDPRPPREIYHPGHPDANADGIVQYPNVRVHEEMADLISSSRAMEANLAIIRTSRSMALQTLRIGKA